MGEWETVVGVGETIVGEGETLVREASVGKAVVGRLPWPSWGKPS